MNAFYSIACSTCQSTFQASGDSIGYSIFFLLIIILSVLGAVGFCLCRLVRRGNENLDPELRDDYVHH